MRVLVVDDDEVLLRVLGEALRRGGHHVLEARSAMSCLAIAAAEAPDAVLLDLRLPDLDGIEVTRRLRTSSDVPVLLLSGAGSELRRVAALEVGADDFIDKPFSLLELSARLTAVLRRCGARPGSMQRRMRVGEVEIDLEARTLTSAGHPVRLTRTEWRLLEVLTASAGHAVSYRRLIQGVWSHQHGDESRASLRAHLKSLRSKLGDDAREPRFVRTEVGYGYRWVASLDP